MLTELMCDTGAVALFGPSALWTISSFAATRELDVEPSPATQFYPSWRLRICTIIEYLKGIDDVETHFGHELFHPIVDPFIQRQSANLSILGN